MDIALSMAKDLYGQRHIAYFDPSFRFDHVEPIEQFDNDDHLSRSPTSHPPKRSVSISLVLVEGCLNNGAQLFASLGT